MSIDQVITTAPLPAPSRNLDTPSEFSDNVDAQLSWERSYTPEVNTWADQANTLATEVNTDATNAEASALIAQSAANFKGLWVDLTGAVNVPSSVFHSNQYWNLVNDLVDVTTSEPGVTSDWIRVTISNIGLEFILGYEPTPQQLIDMGGLERDGSSLLDVDYPELLAVWGGKLYGNADGTHFYLPDDRGKFERIWDHGAGVDPGAVSRTNRGDGTIGDNVGTNQDYQLEEHDHTGFDTQGFTASATGGNAVGRSGNSGLTGGNETRPINTYKFGGIFVK